jgi:thioredoxin reductase
MLPSLKKAGKPEESYGTVVVGAGPAVLAAAIYIVRANLKAATLEIRSHMELERRDEP